MIGKTISERAALAIEAILHEDLGTTDLAILIVTSPFSDNGKPLRECVSISNVGDGRVALAEAFIRGQAEKN